VTLNCGACLSLRRLQALPKSELKWRPQTKKVPPHTHALRQSSVDSQPPDALSRWPRRSHCIRPGDARVLPRRYPARRCWLGTDVESTLAISSHADPLLIEGSLPCSTRPFLMVDAGPSDSGETKSYAACDLLHEPAIHHSGRNRPHTPRDFTFTLPFHRRLRRSALCFLWPAVVRSIATPIPALGSGLPIRLLAAHF